MSAMTTGYAIREAATLAPVSEIYPAGRYFTDERNLYRIVGWLSRPVGPDLAEIEDSVSLERILVAGDDLGGLRLRAVHAESDALLVVA